MSHVSPRLLLSLALLTLLPATAFAFPRMPYDDDQVVSRSPLIVVAHLKPGSIVYVPHIHAPNEGNSGEYHATLVITQTLKGTPADKEIPIIIHYGLGVFINGKDIGGSSSGDMDTYPKDSIQIIDTGSDLGLPPPLVPDAARDNLWFLRQYDGVSGHATNTGDFGILDPPDLKPLASKDYLINFLAPDPAAAMRAYIEKTPNPDPRAAQYLDHLNILKISGIKDLSARVDQLLPYFIKDTRWNGQSEVSNKLMDAGPDAFGPPLLKLLASTQDRRLRHNIIQVWGGSHYPGFVEALIAQLQSADEFWAAQKLEPGWLGKESPQTAERRNRYNDVQDAVYALMLINDPRAKPILQATLKRWQSPDFTEYSHAIVEFATAALNKLH